VPDPRDGRALIVRRTEKGWRVNQTARRLVKEIQADWAEQLGSEAMTQLFDLLQQLHQVLGFEYSRRIGGLPSDTS
jgi:DNA-binding MarR family transcriptional regulator